MTHVTPNLDQDGWRLRNDDGNQTAATWIAALNTSATITPDVVFRIRIRVRETAGAAAAFSGPLEYNRNGGGWNNVTTSSAVMRHATSAHVTDNTATTDQLGGTGTFVAGVIDDNGSYSGPSLNNQRTEIEFVVRLVAADVATSDTIQFRISGLDAYTATGSLTVGAAPATRTVVASGGLRLGGTAGYARERSQATAGGLRINGAAGIATSIAGAERVVEAEGGIALGGAAAFARAVTRLADGGLVLAGAAELERAATIAAAGGLLVNGAAQAVRERVLLADGGLELGGEAGFDTLTGISVDAEGGLVLAGDGAVIRIRDARPAGGIRLAGTAAPTASAGRDADGGLELGGSASVAFGDPVILPTRGESRRQVSRGVRPGRR